MRSAGTGNYAPGHVIGARSFFTPQKIPDRRDDTVGSPALTA